MATINARMRQRRRTAAQWTTEDPVLDPAEFGVESDTGRIKVGDGTTTWTALPYAALTPDEAVTLDTVQTISAAKTFGVSPNVPNPAAVDNSAVSRQEAAATAAFLAQTAVDGLPELATSDPAKMPMSTTGGITTLDVDSLAWAPLVSRLTADTTINNTTTMTDSGLTVTLESNAVYRVDAIISYTGGSTSADINFGWTTPSGATGFWIPRTIAPGITTIAVQSVRLTSLPWSTASGGAGTVSGLDVGATPTGVLVTGASGGDLDFQFAQGAAEAVDTTVHANSVLIAQRIA